MTVWATRCIDGKVDPEVLADVIERIVEVTSPERIVLFGSAARGEMGPNSDIDLLIVADVENCLDAMRRIYGNLHSVPGAVDAIVVTPGDVEKYRDSHALIIKPALQEGEVVYESR